MAHNPPPTILRPVPAPLQGALPPTWAGWVDGLWAILQQLGLQAFAPTFQKEELSVEVLATWNLPTVKAYIRDLLGGLATQLLEHCKVPASSGFRNLSRSQLLCSPLFL